MGNTFADITEDGNVWDENRLKISEDTLEQEVFTGEDGEAANADDDECIVEPTILVAPVAFENKGPAAQPLPDWREAARRRAARRRGEPDAAIEKVWAIEMERSEGQTLGLGMRLSRNGRLEITSIDQEGIVAAWNTREPTRAVRTGDRILTVNGAAGKDQIYRLLMTASKLSVLAARDPNQDSEFDAGILKPHQVVLKPGSETPGSSSSKASTAAKRRWAPLEECPAIRDRVLLTPLRLSELHPFLPLTVRFASNWKLIYCPRIHGTSLRTFYRQCQAWPSETLFLIEDSEGAVFGGFASCPWKVSREKVHYGAPDCFVFSYGVQTDNSLLQVYPWTGGNEFFMFADFDGFSMGGGQKYAIWVDQEFLRGTSHHSSTFGNEGPLASGEDFVIRHFECWAFDSDNFGSAMSQAIVREHRTGLRDGRDALESALREEYESEEALAEQELIDSERRRGRRDLELRDYASQADRFEAIC